MYLKKLDQCTESSYLKYLSEFTNEIEQPFSSYLMNLDYSAWIEKSKTFEDISLLPNGYVPSFTYFLVNNQGEILGNISIRTELNDYLRNYGGNIGYVVSPRFRGSGFGSLQLKLALKEAKKLNLNQVLLTCDKSNISSAKVILKNGGSLESESVINGTEIQRYLISIE